MSEDSASTEGVPVKIIKRYANRKLYDTERSCYVTLDEISQMIKDGEEVRVVDNKTKEDLSAVTLAQIIVEEEKKVSRMPLKLLRGIIQSSNDALGDFYQKHFADPAKNIRDDVERRVDGLLNRKDGEPGAPGEASAPPASSGGEGEQAKAGDRAADKEKTDGPVRAFVQSTTEAFENMQRTIDEGVKDALGRMTHLSHARPDFDRLLSRVEELDARIKRLENGAASDD